MTDASELQFKTLSFETRHDEMNPQTWLQDDYAGHH